MIFLPFETPSDDLVDMTIIWLTNLQLEVPEEAIFLYHLIPVLLLAPLAVNGNTMLV